MTTIREHSFHESRTEQHRRLLNQLDNICIIKNHCDICHCDCYNDYDNEKDNMDNLLFKHHSQSVEHLTKKTKRPEPSQNIIKSANSSKESQSKETTIKDICNKDVKPILSPSQKKFSKQKNKRSKSMGNSRNQKCCYYDLYNIRDCDILRELLNSIDDEQPGISPINIKGTTKFTSTDSLYEDKIERSRSLYTQDIKGRDINNNLAPIRLCKSIADLCLLPTVREAYLEIPAHDKRILNRMAAKRHEQATAKENAWLAQKYWENERYERELLKCEQMEEYKKAVCDKRFQDYLKTKARFNEIARRDVIELKRLKELIHQKDVRTKKRLNVLHTERNNTIKQKQYEEFRKTQAINLQQAENQLDNLWRKNTLFQRITERLQKANKLRNEILENQIKRLRYNNYIEQLQHQELWHEVQTNQLSRYEQLKAAIAHKRCRSQQFLHYRQKHMEAIKRKSAISQNLRELVRSSVSPDTNSTLCGTGGLRSFPTTQVLSKLLLHESDTKNAHDKSKTLTL